MEKAERIALVSLEIKARGPLEDRCGHSGTAAPPTGGERGTESAPGRLSETAPAGCAVLAECPAR